MPGKQGNKVNPQAKPVLLRGIDPNLWQKVRREAIERGQTVGQVVNDLLRRAFGREA